MLDMNPGIRAQWTAALRSGEYEQGASYLRYKNAFCCLGVLCDLAVKDGVLAAPDEDPDEEDVWVYGEANAMLPEAVQDWAGLSESPVADVVVGDDCSPFPHELTHLNDDESWTFAQIADAIDGGAA